MNAITDTNSTQSCNLCSAKPSEMNKLDIIREKVCNEQAFTFHLNLDAFKAYCFETSELILETYP